MTEKPSFFNPVKVPSWRLSLDDAHYYGWRYCLHIGPWLLFFWPLNDDQLENAIDTAPPKEGE